MAKGIVKGGILPTRHHVITAEEEMQLLESKIMMKMWEHILVNLHDLVQRDQKNMLKMQRKRRRIATSTNTSY